MVSESIFRSIIIIEHHITQFVCSFYMSTLSHRYSIADKETCAVNYKDLIEKFNWRDCAVAPPSVPVALASDWAGTKAVNQLDAVNYASLMKDLAGGSK